jgi:hypothetical protein
MLESFVRWWNYAGKNSRYWQPCVLVSLGLINLVVFAVGVPRLRIYGHDVFVSLDGAWRILNGQIPVVHYYAQMGPLYYLLHASGLALAGGDARGLGYGSTLAGVLIAIWSFLLLRRRMVPAPFFLACLAVLLLAVAPFPLGLEPWQSAFSMKHNRYGFALTSLVLLESFLDPDKCSGRKMQFGGGFSTGLACVTLLFLKISYGLVALGIAAASVVLRPRERGRLAGLAAGFLLAGLPILMYLRFDVGALIREYRLLATVHGEGLIPFRVWERFYIDRFETAPLLLLTLLTAMLPGTPFRRRIALGVAAVLATMAGTLLLLTNTQFQGLPLLAAVALLVIDQLSPGVEAETGACGRAPLLCFALLAVGIPMALDAAGLAMAFGDKILPLKPGYRLQGPHLEALEFVDCSGRYCVDKNDNGEPLVRYTEEGMTLISRYARPGESVLGMGMSNPFSYGMLRPPAHGGTVTISGTNVSVWAIPAKERLIGDVDLILIPAFPASERRVMTIVLNRYPEVLGSEYARVAESENWSLYRRQR